MRLGKVLLAGLVAYGIVKLTEHIAEKAAKTVIEEEKKDHPDEEALNVPTVGEVVRRIIGRHIKDAVVGVVDDILGTGRRESSANRNRYHYQYARSCYGMFVCEHCGHTLRPEDRWCPNCGEKVTEGRYHYG